MRRVWLVHLFPVTFDDGIDVHVNVSYFQAQGVRQLHLVNFLRLKFSFNDVSSDRLMSSLSAFVDIPVVMSP
jgi:hypothetical protein